MSESISDAAFDIGAAFGATSLPAVDRLTLYLPNMDCDQNPVSGVEDWIEYGMRLLTDINGGVTRLPWASGRWKRSDGQVVEEQTTVIYSSLMDPERFQQEALQIRAFLHAFGRYTNQGAVMFDISGIQAGDDVSEGGAPVYAIRTYEITSDEYDPPAEAA